MVGYLYISIGWQNPIQFNRPKATENYQHLHALKNKSCIKPKKEEERTQSNKNNVAKVKGMLYSALTPINEEH